MTVQLSAEHKEVVEPLAIQEESMFKKFGGDEKCRQLIDKLHTNLSENVDMCPFFTKQQ
jgi:hypothetical protein